MQKQEARDFGIIKILDYQAGGPTNTYCLGFTDVDATNVGVTVEVPIGISEPAFVQSPDV